MNKLIWQPVGLRETRSEFGILLDENFARRMIRLKVKEGFQDVLNSLGTKHLSRLGIEWSRPFQFYEDSAFVEGFHLGHPGVRLEIASYMEREDLLSDSATDSLIRYSSGNVDSAEQRSALLNLVDLWYNHTKAYEEFSS